MSNIAIKGQSYTVYMSVRDSDGDLLNGLSLIGYVSKDGAEFIQATNSITELTVSGGVYKLILTVSEMNADTVIIKFISTNLEAKTPVSVINTTLASPAMIGDAMTLTLDYEKAKTAAQTGDIPNISLLALEETVQSIKTRTELIPDQPSVAGEALSAVSGLASQDSVDDIGLKIDTLETNIKGNGENTLESISNKLDSLPTQGGSPSIGD